MDNNGIQMNTPDEDRDTKQYNQLIRKNIYKEYPKFVPPSVANQKLRTPELSNKCDQEDCNSPRTF